MKTLRNSADFIKAANPIKSVSERLLALYEKVSDSHKG
jgi:hypothetical protein